VVRLPKKPPTRKKALSNNVLAWTAGNKGGNHRQSPQWVALRTGVKKKQRKHTRATPFGENQEGGGRVWLAERRK